MFELQVLPRLRPLVPPAVLRTRWYRTTGIGESDLDQRIAPVYTRYTNPATTVLAAPGDVHVHLRARSEFESEADALLLEVGSQIEELLGDHIYSTDGATLDEVVGRLLVTRGETLCVAESVTGGGLGERLTRAAGASRYFLGGLLTYSDEVKERLLGVPSTLLKEHSAVSEPVARAMAEGARQRLGADWAIATTGYAGPQAEPDGALAGTVFVAISNEHGTVVHRHSFGGDRERIRHFCQVYSLDHLRRQLTSSQV